MPAERTSQTTVNPSAPVDRSDPSKGTCIEYNFEIKEPTALLWLNASGLTIADAALTANGETVAARVVPGGEDFVGFAFDRQVPKGNARLTLHYAGAASAQSVTRPTTPIRLTVIAQRL